jgi:hypothetical protein
LTHKLIPTPPPNNKQKAHKKAPTRNETTGGERKTITFLMRKMSWR